MEMEGNKPDGIATGGRAMSGEKTTRALDERNNPCVKEHHLSQECLSRNDYQYSSCGIYFENYRRCKKFWGKVKAERRRAGILPHLPPPEERPPYLLQHTKTP